MSAACRAGHSSARAARRGSLPPRRNGRRCGRSAGSWPWEPAPCPRSWDQPRWWSCRRNHTGRGPAPGTSCLRSSSRLSLHIEVAWEGNSAWFRSRSPSSDPRTFAILQRAADTGFVSSISLQGEPTAWIGSIAFIDPDGGLSCAINCSSESSNKRRVCFAQFPVATDGFSRLAVRRDPRLRCRSVAGRPGAGFVLFWEGWPG